MPVAPAYRPDPKFQELGAEFADPVRAEAFPKTILRYRNDRAAATVGLDTLTDDEWIAHFGRFEPLPDNLDPPLAQRYHGHQFRVYNPELGDGRGFVFAQMREAGTGRLLDLGTKGSGRTPWSRSGDGRLTLKGGVREVLATAMLEALGVPTSRSFSLVETGEALVRGDEPSPTRSSVLVRLSHSHIRFGTFQRHAFFERPDRVAALVDHVVAHYYPALEGSNEKPVALLREVTARMARLTARWMAAGFVHGVLNTDNMSLTGESFDYGPYRFLPKSNPAFTAAYFDQQGLYAFGRQPEAVFWNLQQLGGCLTYVAGDEPLIEALNGFGPAYRQELVAAMLARLGLAPDWGATYFLPRLVGPAKALELALTGEMIDAREAFRLGLVSRVVPPAQLDTTVRSLAEKLAAGPSLAFAQAKRSIYRDEASRFEAALDHEIEAQMACFLSEDAREGVEAFLKHRPPKFVGK